MIDEYGDTDGDQSLWLPRGESLVTKERLEKGDMRTFGDGGIAPEKLTDIRFAQALVRNIMQFLWNCGTIDDQNYHDGKTFQIWQEVFSAPFGYRKNSVYHALKGELSSEGLNEYGFVLLLQRMHHNDIRQIEKAIDTMQTEHTVFLARKNATIYRRAFARLSEVIPQIRDDLESIAKHRETASETLDDMFLRLSMKMRKEKNV